MMTPYHAIIVGGGPAGLSAALYLGRVRRRTLVLDAGRPRNAVSPAAHGVFTRDGTSPKELLEEARRQLSAYATVEVRPVEAVGATARPTGFVVRLADGQEVQGRRLLLACGVRDVLPAVEGFEENWGKSVLHCAYCHGFEFADQPIAIYACGRAAMESAASLLHLSRLLLICTDGHCELTELDRRRLGDHDVRIIESPLVKVSGASPRLVLRFADGSSVVRSAVFVKPALDLASRLPLDLGCRLDAPGRLQVDASWRTTVPGVYAAGDIAAPKSFVAVAAASGAQAAVALHGELAQEDFGGEWSGPLCSRETAGQA
jgi:thioredoxin reductase